MIAAINICEVNLVKSKTLPTFAMRTGERFPKSQPYIQAVAFHKATSLRQFYFGSLDLFAKLQGGVASFAIYIHQIFSQMRAGKNLKADTLGASASTPNTRKRVKSLKSDVSRPITPYSELKHEDLQRAFNAANAALEAANQALETVKHKLYRVSIHALARWNTENYKGGILNTDNYSALSEFEAIGMAVRAVTKLHPLHNIVADQIKVQLIAPMFK